MGNQAAAATASPGDDDDVRRASVLSAEDAAKADDMAALLKAKMETDYAAGATLRDGHPKALGVVRGTFSVDAALAPELDVGFFAANKGRSFDCVVRYSSASGEVQPDSARDLRGLAIKLFQSHDARVPTTELKALGQDFVLLSCPTMPLGTVDMFHVLVESKGRYGSMALAAARLLVRGELGRLVQIVAYGIAPDSILDIPFYSTTPYRFGEHAQVKYKLVPSPDNAKAPVPHVKGDSYLTDGIRSVLVEQGKPLSYDLCVQLRKPHMPLDDAGVLWSEGESPPRKVATLHIPPQELLSADVSERLFVNPATAFPEHAPLGGINLARERIYKELTRFRHERDNRPYL